ncbi:hypothetical protein E6H13_09885 [Candidatus Bathyarchaeota archaeon]|nr:MAG: hypothetical protein E6H13_09885 [Candidatus Bathyarchaeota archaeon]TMI60574.1 MAG: hypothetical protein E6H12_10040 [Candidatus Bathyarchaeota archaeon]
MKAVFDKEEFGAELDLVCHAEWSSSPREIRLRPVTEHINRYTFEIAIETTLGLGLHYPTSSKRRRRK